MEIEMRKYERPKITVVELRIHEAVLGPCKATSLTGSGWGTGKGNCTYLEGTPCAQTGS